MHRTCSSCGETKDIAEFEKTRKYHRSKCNSCRYLQKKTVNPERLKASSRKLNVESASRRRSYRDWAIYVDCKGSDGKRGLTNDLDRPFILQVINGGCSYCGETQIRMTLDRKDNAKAHTRENVVAACIRCNYMRGSMPYLAWVEIVPLLRGIREKGLFGDWHSEPFNLRHTNTAEVSNPMSMPKTVGVTMVSIECLECRAQVKKVAGYISHNLKKGHRGPFCGRPCAAKYSYRNR